MGISKTKGEAAEDLETDIFDCNLGEIHEVGKLSDLYHKAGAAVPWKEEDEFRYTFIKPINFTIRETRILNQSPTMLSGLIQTLIGEDLFYMQALEGKKGMGKILIRNEEKLYLIKCKKVTAKKLPQVEKCYIDESVWYKEKIQFVNAATRILQSNSEEIQCGSRLSLFFQLVEAINDQKLIKLSNKAITFSLWKGKTFTKDIAKLLNKESTRHLMESEEGIAYGDITGKKIMAQVQLFLRLHAAKIAITWGILQFVGICAVIIIGRYHKVKWWKIVTILSSIAKVFKEISESILQSKLDRKTEKLRLLQRSKENLLDGNDEEVTVMEPYHESTPTNETHKEFTHRHLDQIYICIYNMVERMAEAEKRNREGKSRNSGKGRMTTGEGEIKEKEENGMELVLLTGRKVYGSDWAEGKWKPENKAKPTKKKPLSIEARNPDEEEGKKNIHETTTTQETPEEAEVERDEGENRRSSGGVSMRWANREELENGIEEGREGEASGQGATTNRGADCEYHNLVEEDGRRWRRRRRETKHNEDEGEKNEERTNTGRMDTERQEDTDL